MVSRKKSWHSSSSFKIRGREKKIAKARARRVRRRLRARKISCYVLHHFSYRAKVGERELEVQQKTKKSQNQTNPNCHRFDLVFSIKSNMLVCIRRKQKKIYILVWIVFWLEKPIKIKPNRGYIYPWKYNKV